MISSPLPVPSTVKDRETEEERPMSSSRLHMAEMMMISEL